MINHSDILQLCRLCLVEEQVNHSIFEESSDLRGIFLKITSCLPVSISKDDSLPKKICDTCSNKLDSFYQFWNETANAEKQLRQWLTQTALGQKVTHTETNKSKMDGTEVKQEDIEVVDSVVSESMEISSDAKTYILQQQQLPYAAPTPKILPVEKTVENETEEPASKRPRRASAMKALEHMESEDDDDDLDDGGDNYAKAESDDSDKEEDDETYAEGPSTSMDDQPGPSGVGKGSTEAPLIARKYVTVQCQDKEGSKCDPTIDLNPCETCEKSLNQARMSDTGEHHIENLAANPFKCSDCENIFLFKCEYRNHYKSSHDTFPFGEETENKLIVSARSRNKYTPFKTEGGYKCSECGKLFGSTQSCRRHQRVEHEKKTFVCDLCGKVVTSLASLRDHKRVHTGEKPFACTDCGKMFARRQFLIIHERSHTGVKPHRCELCDKSFTQRSTLNVHMKYHSGERPYPCSICEKAFVTKTLMKTHLKTRHGVSEEITLEDK